MEKKAPDRNASQRSPEREWSEWVSHQNRLNLEFTKNVVQKTKNKFQRIARFASVTPWTPSGDLVLYYCYFWNNLFEKYFLDVVEFIWVQFLLTLHTLQLRCDQLNGLHQLLH